MSRVVITTDPRAFDDARALLDPVAYVVAAQAAISRTVNSGVARSARIVGQKLNLRIGDIKDAITAKKSNFSSLEGSILFDRKPLALAEFRPTQTKKGVAVKVWKDGSREVLKSTFKATMKSGHAGVFERVRGTVGTFDQSVAPARFVVGGTGGGKSYIKLPAGSRNRAFAAASAVSGRVARLPIQERFGPTVVAAVTGTKKHAGAEQDIAIDLTETLEKNLDSQIRRILNNPGSIRKLRAAAEAAISS